MTPLLLLLAFSTAQRWDGATFSIQYSDNIVDDVFTFPFSLPNNGTTSPALGYFESHINLIDSIHNKTYSRDATSDHGWNEQTHNGISSSGECMTSSCFAQIDKYLYILYDNNDKMIKYNMDNDRFEFDIEFNYPGYYCLVNDDEYIYAIGDEPNIIIISSIDTTESSSTAYLPNDISFNDPFACSIDTAQEYIYIFTNSGAFSYSISNDTLSTIYYTQSELPYIDSTNITSVTGNNLIWIQNSEYLYPFSSVTNKFLRCRAQLNTAESASSLLFIDGYMLRFGGNGVDDEWLTNISVIDASFDSNRFVLNDWYYPGHNIAFSYSDSFINAVDSDSIHITLSSDDFMDIKDEIISFLRVADLSINIDDGLSIDLDSNMEDIINRINQDNDIDIGDISYSIEATTLDLDDSSSPLFVCNSFKLYPVYLSLSATLLSGEYFYLKFNYEYLCNSCNMSTSSSFSSSVKMVVAALGINEEITMDIIDGKSCDIDGVSCDEYILYDLTEIFFDGEYIIQLSSSDTFLSKSQVELDLSASTTHCRLGTGYDEDSNSCHSCADGTFSFKSDLRECQSCSGLEGVECDGSDRITVQYRYWLSGYRKSQDKYITLFDMNNGSLNEDDDILISHICGYGQCCADFDGCDYVDTFNDGTICAKNRDLTTPMCTSCEAGWYELLSTNDCGACDYHRNLWHLVWIFAMAFILVLYLAFIDAQPLEGMLHNWRHRNDEDVDEDELAYADLNTKTSGYNPTNKDDDDLYESDSDFETDSDANERYQGKTRRKKRKKKDYAAEKEAQMNSAERNFKFFVADAYIAYSVLILQIFAYYFQGYAEILQSEGTRAFVGPIINLFNLNFVNNRVGGDNVGFCFIPKQSSLNEISVTLIFPGLMVLSLLFLSMFCSKGTMCIRIQSDVCKCQEPMCNKPYIAIAFCRISMLSIGLLFRVLMQLITCTRFTEDTYPVQFYHFAGCYEAAWWLSMAAMIIFLLYIISVYKKMYSQSDEQRFSPSSPYTKLIQAYKNEYWYWEAIITLRRFLLTMFVTLSFLGRGYSNLIFCVVLLFFLLIHISANPFLHKRNNRVETFCLLSLLIGFIGINFDDIADSLFLSLFLGVVIFVPVLIALLFLGQLCLRCSKYFNGDEQYYIDNCADDNDDNNNNKYQSKDKMESMMTRVLKKKPTEFFDKRKDNKKMSNKYADDHDDNAGYTGYHTKEIVKVEMATLSYPRKHSESSCGLSAD